MRKRRCRVTGSELFCGIITRSHKLDIIIPPHTFGVWKSKTKANSRLKQIEKEYTLKLAKSSQIIADLQTTISSLKEESSRQQLAAERRLQDVVQKFEDEKQQLIRDNDQAIKALQAELETRSNQVRSAEKKLQHKELEAQEQ
ncbi:hypothetical protein STEG23_006458, partial [Scotinomys teguina]